MDSRGDDDFERGIALAKDKQWIGKIGARQFNGTRAEVGQERCAAGGHIAESKSDESDAD